MRWKNLKRIPFRLFSLDSTTKSSFSLQNSTIAHYSQVSLEVNSTTLNVCSPLNQDGIPQASLHHYSIISGFYFHKSNNTSLPNRKEKRLTALEIVTQSKEGRFIAGKTLFLIYQIPQAGFMRREKTTKMFFRKGTWQQRQTWLRKGQDRMQGS